MESTGHINRMHIQTVGIIWTISESIPDFLIDTYNRLYEYAVHKQKPAK